MKHLVLVKNKEFEDKLSIESEKIQITSVKPENLRTVVQKKEDLVVIQGGDERINRLAVETKGVDVLLSPEKNNQRDFMFFRNSGLNQVLCKLAYKNKVSIGFNFLDVINSKGINRSRIIARMRQNVKLCKKYKVKMIFSSFATNRFELRSNTILSGFAKILGF